MHILFVADSDSKYGASRALYQMISSLIKLNLNIRCSVVITKDSSQKEELEALGCDVYPIPYLPYQLDYPQKLWKFPAKLIIKGVEYLIKRIHGIRILEQELDISSIDIIHSNSSREDISVTLSQKYNKPLIWHIREFGDLDVRLFSLRRDYVKLMNEHANIIIAISEAVKEHWINKGIHPDKFVRIYDGVDENIFQKTYYNTKDEAIVRFVMVGSISEAKGQYQLLEAIEKLPFNIRKKISVDIIGGVAGKTYGENINRKIASSLSDCAHIFGYQKDISSHLYKYDCGIICSRSEGLGLVTIEYMMAGLPVIASDTGANPELVEEGETGLFYHWGDTLDLSDKMRLIVENAELREKMGRRGSVLAREKFTSHINAQNIYDIYKMVLDG